jgi:hypothetical protein
MFIGYGYHLTDEYKLYSSTQMGLSSVFGRQIVLKFK